jgi:hypothetical protein
VGQYAFDTSKSYAREGETVTFSATAGTANRMRQGYPQVATGEPVSKVSGNNYSFPMRSSGQKTITAQFESGLSEWTTFFTTSGVTVSAGDDATWRNSTPAQRLATLSLDNADTTLLWFNSATYAKYTIKSITFGQDVEGVDKTPVCFLKNFTGLTAVDLSALWKTTTIDSYFMQNCYSITAVDLSPMVNVTTININLLSGCASLVMVDLSGFSKLRSIGSYFLSATPIQTIDMSAMTSLTEINYYFLANCTKLKTLDLSALAKVTRLGRWFLQNCTSLKTLDLAPLTKDPSLGMYFLEKCTGLTQVNMGTIASTNIEAGGSFSKMNTCVVTVKGLVSDWTSRFTDKAAGVTFSL